MDYPVGMLRRLTVFTISLGVIPLDELKDLTEILLWILARGWNLTRSRSAWSHVVVVGIHHLFHLGLTGIYCIIGIIGIIGIIDHMDQFPIQLVQLQVHSAVRLSQLPDDISHLFSEVI